MGALSRYTKRDYELAAGVIRDAAHVFNGHPVATAHTVLAHVAARFASKFQIDDPAFDLERFAAACGLTKERTHG